MKQLIFLTFTVVLLFSCGTTKQSSQYSKLNEEATLVVSYYQTSGLSKQVPEYRIELYSNHQMHLTAIKNLDKEGKFLRSISDKEYEQVIKSFIESNFFKLNNEYTSESLDLPTRYLFFSHNGKEKKIKDYDNTPEDLKELEFLMQSFLDRVGWEKMAW